MTDLNQYKGTYVWLDEIIQETEALREALKLALSFAPKGPVPEGLAPMFYHTLEYKTEVELQERIDKARELIAPYSGQEKAGEP